MVRPHRHTVPALIAAFLLSLFTIIPTSANNVAQAPPFSQNWTDEDQIAVSDNWSGVLGIEGFLGQDITTGIGVDPQTLLGVSTSANDLDVTAEVQLVAITNGGVAEFEVTSTPTGVDDAVVALQGSGTADAPYLLFHVDTTDLGSINVSYDLRDIDLNDNAVQPVALQYRVGSSGNFVNLPEGFVSDATEGGAASLVTHVSVVLPAAASDQPLVQIRVMTTNATGSDEWVGVDNISVTGEEITDPTPTPTPEPTATPTPTPEGSPTPTPTPEASPTPTPTPTPTPVLITISQVYGGGGNTNAPFTHDFIELFNRSGVAQSLAGMSVQYARATGTGTFGATSTQLTELPNVTLEPGEYFLIQEAGGSNGVALPQPDLVDGTPIAMAAGAGKVALVTGQEALGCNGGSAPCSDAQLARIVDLVGYGNANFFEGTGAAPTLSNTTAALRNDGGAADTNDNSADFIAGAPMPHLPETAPNVASSLPSNGAEFVATFATLSVTFSEPVIASGSWYDLTCATSGTHLTTMTGGPTTFTINPTGRFTPGESCSLTVLAANIADLDAVDPPDAMEANATITFTVAPDLVCGTTATPIGQIQGTGATTPMLNSTVEIEGVVVGAYPGTTGFRGFFVQEEDGDGDGDAATSDGMFVFDASGEATYAAGDLVRVRGSVTEFESTANNVTSRLTELTALTNVQTCTTGQSVTPTPIEMPFESATFAERYEGMLVEAPNVHDLVVTELFQFGRFGELVLTTDERQWTPTHLVEPGAPATALQAANELDRVILDDGRNDQNIDPTVFPDGGLSASNTVRIGDTVAGGSFVLEHRFGAYRLQPTDDRPQILATNPRPPTTPDVGGDLRVAAMNVLNYFTTFDTIRGSNNGPNICGPLASLECRGANTDFEFQRQRTKIIEAILGLDASVVGLMEIENNPSASTQDLVDGLNAATAPGTWAFINTGTLGTDAIKVALIYQPADVTPVGAYAVLDSSVDPRFEDARNRPSLAQTFDDVDGARFTVVVNHLKSKGSDCGGAPNDDLSVGGAGNCNGTRTRAAQALVDWIAEDPTDSGDRDVLVIGDLNAYAQEDPIDVFRAAGYTDTLAASLGSEAYSFVFQGMSGYLDHGLASPTLAAQVTGAAEWHINADEPPVLDYNDDFKSPNHVTTLYAPTPYRSSDHDPLVVGLDLLAPFGFDGYRPPVNPGNTATITAGSALPMKFTLDDATGLDVVFSTRSREVSCTTGAPLGAWVPTEATTGLHLNPVTGVYTYDWKTLKQWAGSCRVFEVTLDEGSYWYATITFIK